MIAALFTALGLLLPVLALWKSVAWLIWFYLLCTLGAEPHTLTVSMAIALGLRVVLQRFVPVSISYFQYIPGTLAVGALTFLACYGLSIAILRENTERMLTETVQYLFGAALVFATYVCCRAEWKLRLVLSGLVFGAFVLSIFKFLSSAGIVEWQTQAFISVIDSNYAASYMLLGGVAGSLSLMRTVKWVGRYGLMVCWASSVAGIFLNSSRANLMMAVVLTGFWILRLKPGGTLLRFALLLGIAVGGLVILGVNTGDSKSVWSMFSGSNRSNQIRVALLQQSWHSLSTHPLGLGIGASSEVFGAQAIFDDLVPHPHNSIAQLAVEMGVLGAALGLLTLFWLVTVSAQQLLLSGEMSLRADIGRLFAPCLASWAMFDSVLFNGPLMMLFVIGLAVLLSTQHRTHTTIRSCAA